MIASPARDSSLTPARCPFGWAMVPTFFGIIVSKPSRGVDLVSICIAIREGLAEHREIILHPHQQGISAVMGYAADVEFKRLKKSLMRPNAKPIEIHLASVIHGIEAKNLPFSLEDLGSQVQCGSVKRRSRTEWGP